MSYFVSRLMRLLSQLCVLVWTVSLAVIAWKLWEIEATQTLLLNYTDAVMFEVIKHGQSLEQLHAEMVTGNLIEGLVK